MRAMRFPEQSVTLSPEELQELTKKLSRMRHDINNQLSLIVAAAELIRAKPDAADRMLSALLEQPGRISDSVKKFSTEFDRAMGITRT